jgi:hypothetical protein
MNVEAHHLVPLSEGGDMNGPGTPLCVPCHGATHRNG